MRESVAPAAVAGDGVVELRIPSRAEWVGVARLAVAGIASRLQFSIDDIEDLKLAVAEACTNCIQHATGSDTIIIACRILPDRLTISVTDHGRGTSPEALTPKRPGDQQVGGLGVFLIRSLMDEVEYEVDPQAGTCLRMTKYLRS
jgi:serine/threonine-protein kinase RsbW